MQTRQRQENDRVFQIQLGFTLSMHRLIDPHTLLLVILMRFTSSYIWVAGTSLGHNWVTQNEENRETGNLEKNMIEARKQLGRVRPTRNIFKQTSSHCTDYTNSQHTVGSGRVGKSTLFAGIAETDGTGVSDYGSNT